MSRRLSQWRSMLWQLRCSASRGVYRIVALSIAVVLVVSCDSEVHESESERALRVGQEILYAASDRFQYPEAIALLEQAHASELADAARPLAYAYGKVGKYEEAGALAEATLARKPAAADKAWLEALLHRARDNTPQEIAAWRAIIEANPSDRWALYELASALSSVGNYEESAAVAAKAISVEPSPDRWAGSWIYYLHSKALYRSGDPVAAVPAAEAGKSIPSTWRSTYYRKMLGLVGGDRPDLADDFVTEYRAISSSEGRNNAAYTELNIALFFFELGDYARAAEHAQEGISLESSGYGYWTLAFSLTEAGDPAGGLASAEKGLLESSDNSFLHAARGWALYRLGRLDEASESFAEALRVAKRRPHQIEAMAKVVEQSRLDSGLPPAPPIPWLG